MTIEGKMKFCFGTSHKNRFFFVKSVQTDLSEGLNFFANGYS